MGTSFLRASLIMTVLAALTSASHKGPDAPAAQSLHTGFTCVNGRLAKSGVRLTPPQERAVRLLLGEPMRPLDEALFAQDSSQELRASHRSATPDSGALLKEAAALEKEADKLRWGARRWVQEESQYAGLSHTPPSALIATFPAEMMALEKEQEAADLRRQSRGDDEGELGRGAFVDLNTLACVRASVPLAPRRSLSRAARASPPVGGAAGQRGVAGGRNAGDEEVGEAGREERERRRLFLAAPVGDSGFSADRVPLRTPGLEARLAHLGFDPGDIPLAIVQFSESAEKLLESVSEVLLARARVKGKVPATSWARTPEQADALDHLFVRAAALGDKSSLDTLSAAGVLSNATDAPWGDTPAHAAALFNQPAALNMLLDRGAGVNALTSLEGWTPLHMAAAGGSAAGVQLLLHKGARLDVRGHTPLHLTPLDCAVHFGFDTPHPVGAALREALGRERREVVSWHDMVKIEKQERLEALEGTQVSAKHMVPMQRDMANLQFGASDPNRHGDRKRSFMDSGDLLGHRPFEAQMQKAPVLNRGDEDSAED